MTPERLGQLRGALTIGFAGPKGSALHAYTLLVGCHPTLDELDKLADYLRATAASTFHNFPQGDTDESKVFWMTAGADMESRHDAELRIVQQVQTVAEDTGPRRSLGWPRGWED